MKRRQNDSDRASALKITLSVALIATSAILLGAAAPTNTKKASRQVTAIGQSSVIAPTVMFTDASPTSTGSCSGKIAFTSNRDGNQEIYVMDAVPGAIPSRLTNNPALDAYPSFSPDGSKIAFMSTRDGNLEIYVMDAVPGAIPSRLTNNAASDGNPSFSPDGSKIAFMSTRDGTAQIYVMNANGTNQTRLTNTSPAFDDYPSFSPDGSKIAFTSDRDLNKEIYVMDAVPGAIPSRLTNNPAFDGKPSFSPDGSKIAFASGRDGNSEIYVMDPVPGAIPSRLTNNAAADDPSFSRDGSKIAFTSVLDGNYEIYVMDAVPGAIPSRLTNNAAEDYFPSFGGCSALVLIGLEVTQGVQDLNNSVELIENKPTLVRAYVKNLSQTPITTGAGLEVRDLTTGQIHTMPCDNPNMKLTVPRDPNRSVLEDSFYFALRPEWTRAGRVEIHVFGDPENFECGEGVPEDICPRLIVEFRRVDPLDIKFLRLTWKDAAGVEHFPPSNGNIGFVRDKYLEGYPVNTLNLDGVSQIVTTDIDACEESGGGLGKINTLLADLRNSDCSNGPCKTFYQGILQSHPASGCNTVGLGERPGHVSVAFFESHTYEGHELGHNLGLYHTNYSGNESCGLGVPFPCTRLEGDSTLSLSKEQFAPETVFGISLLTSGSVPVIYPPKSPDFMSYGPQPTWYSRWNYLLLYTRFATENPRPFRVNQDFNAANVSVSQTIVIDGAVRFDSDTGQIGSVFINATPVTLTLPSPGDYSIRFEDSQGAELARFSFNPASDGDFSPIGMISLLLPYDTNTKRIVLLHNETVLASRLASVNPPSVDVTFPNGGEVLDGSSAVFTWTASDLDGDVLNYKLEYSKDNGLTWQTLAFDLHSSEQAVDLTSLAGSDQALIRVTASDGLNCSRSQSDGTFTVAKHAPSASISKPADNQLYVGDQVIILRGDGADAEDGTLDDSRLTWASDLNGVLGNGGSLAVTASMLQEGIHNITLTVIDSTAQTDSASIAIRVSRTPVPLPATLVVAPANLPFRLQNGQASAQVIAIRNSGDGDLDWSAGADQPWIHLASTGGSAPFDLDVTVDSTGLPIGDYSGNITIASPGALDSPQVVTVNLLVQEATPTATPTATATTTPAATATATPTTTATSTPTATATATPTATATATPTATATATATSTPTSTATSTPTPTPIPQAGSFLIGDLDAVVGRKITFWGAKWAKANHLSGGSAPSSFKGFANVLNPNPPLCGGTWQSDPGNSCHPPNKVPAFINVIAASSITKSGPVINGNSPKMVIVQTDPGYGPGPGHTGTGTVTAVICPQ